MNSKKPGLACGVVIRMTSCVIGVLGLLSSTASAQSYIFSRAEFGTFGPPNNVTAADFNGDGKVDLAVTNVFGNGGTVSILLGKPDGTFALNNQDILIVGYGPSSIAAADFNSDFQPRRGKTHPIRVGFRFLLKSFALVEHRPKISK